MTTMTEDDRLLAAWKTSHDAKAFQTLCERYAGLVESVCWRQRSPDAGEAVQAVFLVLARRAGSVAGSSLGAWLTTTAQRVVRDQHRGAARRRRHEQEAAVEQARQRADTEPVWAEAREHLDEALASLSAGRREAILRFYFAGQPQAEVAAELGCSVAAVKMRVHEGLEGLRAFLARKGLALGAVALASGLASEATASEPALVTTCVQTVLTPATAPGAAALANGVVTAMIIKTATLIAAGLVLVGSCLTAALVVGAEPAPTPVAVPAAPTPVPAAPAVAKPAWASELGKDQYGTWADLQVAGVTQRMRLIPSGTFQMGSANGSDNEKPVHQVTLSAFWLGDSEVTQGMWQAVMGANPSNVTGDASRPVEMVSWDDCQGFFQRLNGQVRGLTAIFPSEAQWEYACRAGSGGDYAEDLGSMAWYEDNADGQTHPVKGKQANAFGLYDMHGNVWEWCADWRGTYPAGAATDPLGPSSGSYRVIRGGCWNGSAGDLRSAVRAGPPPDLRYTFLGFRVAAQATP
jgi:sulfatase modifying factor 1